MTSTQKRSLTSAERALLLQVFEKRDITEEEIDLLDSVFAQSAEQSTEEKFYTEQSLKESFASVLARIAYENFTLGRSERVDDIQELIESMRIVSDRMLCELSDRELDDIENATYFFHENVTLHLDEMISVSAELRLSCERAFIEVERYHDAIVCAQNASQAYARENDLVLSLDD